jgi:titin
VNTLYGLTKYSNLLTSGVLDTRIPNAPTGLSAIPSVVGVGVAQVALSWTDNSAIETSYTVQRAVVTNGVVGVYSSLLPAISRVGLDSTGFVPVAFTDTTVALGTSYSYKVFASNANGDSGVSNLVTADLTIPVAPTIQSVTPELTGVAVRWLDNSANESGFLVEISTDAGASWSTVETTAPGVLLSHAPLTQPGTYTFRVSAVNQWGVPAVSTPLTTNLIQPIAPNLQLDSVAPLDATGVNLTWNAVGNAIAYQVEVSSTGVNGTWTAEPATALTTLHLPVLTAGVYNYRVTALTAVTAIKSPASVETVQVDLSMPATPILSQVTDTTGTGVDLSWAAVPGATGYLVEVSATGAAPWTMVETTASNVLTSHATVTTPGAYSYQVTALTPVTGINSLPSNLVAVNLLTPATPTQFVARLVGTGVTAAVDLTWIDNATNESGYAIEVDNGNGWVNKATIAAGAGGTMTWQDTDTIQGIRAYQVIALTPVNAISSLPSNSDSVNYNGTAPLELNSVTVGSITLQSVVLNWTDPAGNNEGGYRVYRSDPTNVETMLIEVPVHTMTYTDTTATAGISYTYRVTAVNPWGETAGKTVVADLSAPVAPSLLAAVIVPDGNLNPSTYTVTWQDNSTNEAYFVLEYSADGGNTWGGANVPPSRTNHLLNATPFTGLTPEAGLPYGVGTGVTGLSIRVYAVNSVGVASPVTATVLLAPWVGP